MTTASSPVAPERAAIPGHVALIFRKEIREIFRDSRTRFAAVLGPLLMTPLLMLLMGNMVTRQREKSMVRTYEIAVVNASSSPMLSGLIRKIPRIHTRDLTLSDAESQVRNHALPAALVLPPDGDARLSRAEVVTFELLKDDADQNSQDAAGRIEATIDAVGTRVVAQRIKLLNLPPSFTEPFRVIQKPISGQSGGHGTIMLAMMLPYLLALSALTGGMYAAFDQVAGEKERGTLETLLLSPASRRDIVLGKFFAVAAVCALSSTLSVVGFVVSFKMKGSIFEMASGGKFHVGFQALGLALLALLLLSVLFAALLVAISTFARNPKEAQSYGGPLVMLVLIPSMMTMFIRTEDATTFALVPIMGTCMLIKQALSNVFDPRFMVLALVSSLFYAALAGAFAVWLFERESVLIKA